MNPRPRGKKASGLPPNLYTRNGGRNFIYRRPDDGTWHGMGSDRHQAIQAAKQLNSLLMEGDSLVHAVMGTGTTVSAFIDTFRKDILPPREWSEETMKVFEVRVRQICKAFGDREIDSITVKDCATLFDAMKPRGANQTRQYLTDIFRYAAAKGLVVDNPAESTILRVEKTQRKRHTVEGLKAIRAASPRWLQNAIDAALITAQRREDIIRLRFDDIREGWLYVVQTKTEKHSDAGFIRFALTPPLKALIARCRDDIPSPYLIHRKPDRLSETQRQAKEHWTAVEPDYLTGAFREARDAAKPYPNLKPHEQPGFHQIRALALHLYKKAGKQIEQRRQIAGHTTERMTKNYESDHEDIVWTDAHADLNIESILG